MVCGDFVAFNDKRWKPADVVAVEDSSAAEFSPEALSKLILEENSNAQFKALVTFLQESIPAFAFLSRHSQERLARFFVERSFVPSQEIIKEGSASGSALFIREGACKVFSTSSPLLEEELQDNKKVQLKVDRRLKAMNSVKKLNGYMSKSTNTYQFHTAAAKDWLGDEVLLNIKAYPYSVVAITSVVVLEISKENLNKFPVDILQRFHENARAKVWLQFNRKDQLQKNITKIYNMNPKFNLTKTSSPAYDIRRSTIEKRYIEKHQQNSNLRFKLNKTSAELEKTTLHAKSQVQYQSQHIKKVNETNNASGVNISAINNKSLDGSSFLSGSPDIRNMPRNKANKSLLERTFTSPYLLKGDLNKSSFAEKQHFRDQSMMSLIEKHHKPEPLKKMARNNAASISYVSLNKGHNATASLTSAELFQDASVLFQPQRVTLGNASLFRGSKSGKGILPAIYRKPVIPSRAHLLAKKAYDEATKIALSMSEDNSEESEELTGGRTALAKKQPTALEAVRIFRKMATML